LTGTQLVEITQASEDALPRPASRASTDEAHGPKAIEVSVARGNRGPGALPAGTA
jgi:hypothetical protein